MATLLHPAASPEQTASSPGRLRRGVTLVELLVFVAVFSIVAFTVLPLLFSATENRMKQQNISLVEQNGAQVLQNIGYRLQYAERITDPPPLQEGPVLTLQTGCGSTNPTIIGIQSGAAIIIRNRTKQVVTSSEVVVKDFRIQNTSASDTQQSFRVSFRVERTLMFKDPQVYSRSFEGLFTLSPAETEIGSVCGGVSCAAPACEGGTYSWEVCEGQACQEVSLLMDCTGYCCSAGGCAAHTSTECGALGGTFHATQAACDAECGAPGSDCGNNVLEPGEECDDGNTTSGDGCSATCQSEWSSSSGFCGPCPPGETCNPSGFCQKTCMCDADCGMPTACYTSVWQMRDYPVCEDGFCTRWISQVGCGDVCDSDADCPVGQQCIPDAEGNNFCNFLGWNVGVGCYVPPVAEQYSCQWEAKNPANGPYYINQPVTLNLSCWKTSGGVPVAADIQTALINGASTVIAGNDASRNVTSATAATVTYTANVTPVGGPLITLVTTVSFTDDSLPDWCQCGVVDTTPVIGEYCSGDTLSINYQCFDGYGAAVPHDFELSDIISVSGYDPYYVQNGEVKAYVTPDGTGTYQYVLKVNNVDMKAQDGSALSCGATMNECGGPSPELSCTCMVSEVSPTPPPAGRICTNEPILASFGCNQDLTPYAAGRVKINGVNATVADRVAYRIMDAQALPGTETFTVTVDDVPKGTCSRSIQDCTFCPSPTMTCEIVASDETGPLGGPTAPGNQLTLTMTCRGVDLQPLQIARALFYQDGVLLGEATEYVGKQAVFRYVTSATATARVYAGVAQLAIGQCGSASATVSYTGAAWCDTHTGPRWNPADLGYPPTGTWPKQTLPLNSDCQYECVTEAVFCRENPGAGRTGCGGGNLPNIAPDKCAVRAIMGVCGPCAVAPL